MTIAQLEVREQLDLGLGVLLALLSPKWLRT